MASRLLLNLRNDYYNRTKSGLTESLELSQFQVARREDFAQSARPVATMSTLGTVGEVTESEDQWVEWGPAAEPFELKSQGTVREW